MLDGLADDEVEDFLEDHPTIVPLFEINAMSPTGQAPETGITEEVPPRMNQIPLQWPSCAKLAMRSNES